MIALDIENINEFMRHLFREDMFDDFCVGGCEVTTFTTYTTDGKRNDAWYDSDSDGTEHSQDATGHVTWGELKPYVFYQIKGTKVPQRLSVRLCHYMPDGDVGEMRIQYMDGALHIFTGYMQREFSLDKEPARAWDDRCVGFLKKNGIVSTH